MNKTELLTLFEGQRNEENAINNLLEVKRKQFENYCEKLIERFKNSFNEYFPKEIIDISKMVGCVDVNLSVPTEILRFNVTHNCFEISLISPNKHTINVYKTLYGDEKWVIYDVSNIRNKAAKRNDSELAYDSGVVDDYKYFIDMVDSHVSEFYRKLSEKNQERLNKRNKYLANVSGSEEVKAKKTYTVSITIEEE